MRYRPSQVVTTIICLAVGFTSPLHAQDPPATNPAATETPGASATTAASIPATQPAASLLPNGNFASATNDPNLPDGWKREKDGLVIYATHFYNWHKNWQKHFLSLAGKYPLFVGEMGADIKKMPFVPANQQEDPSTWMPDALAMIQQYHLNWTAFSLHPKATPVLISGWNFSLAQSCACEKRL